MEEIIGREVNSSSVQKLPTLDGKTSLLLYRAYKIPSLVSILIQINLVYANQLHFFKSTFNIILAFTPL